MAASGDSRYAIPGIISILVVLGIFSVGKQPFEPLRPSATERVDFSESTATRIEARLWQDPFRAIKSFSSAVPDARAQYLDRLWVSQTIHEIIDRLNPDSLTDVVEECFGLSGDDEVISTSRIVCPDLPTRLQAFEEAYAAQIIETQLRRELDGLAGPGVEILLLPVALPSGDYADLIERRRRSRYAVITALTEQRFLPVDAEHLNVLRFPQALCNAGPSSATDCQKSTIPYEYFKQQNKDSKEQLAVVLWLEDSNLFGAFMPTVRGLRKAFTDAAQSIAGNEPEETAAPTVATRLFGPYSSGNLGSAPSEEQLQKLLDQEIRVVNWSATNRDSDAAWKHSWTTTINTDSELLAALVDVVDRRVRGFTFGEDPATDDRTVLLVAEGDTGYSTRLYTLAEEFFSDKGYNVAARSYVRGIDGQYPGHTPRPADRDTRNGPGTLDANSVTARLLASGYTESSSGTGQFDYLRRLANEIAESSARIDAIGVLGSDPYDKALVLQALRPEFPQAVYFTTDLYSLFLRTDSQKIFKNLLVAASHGLETRIDGPGNAARTGPPLRDSYQRSLYEAISLVTRGAMTGSSAPGAQPCGGDAPLDCHEAAVRLFEIGRGEIFELPAPGSEAKPGQAVDGWSALSFAVVHALLAACLGFGVRTYLDRWRDGAIEGTGSMGRRASYRLAVGTGAAFVFVAAASLSVRTYARSYLAEGIAYAPTLAEQTAAACLLAFACAASLALVSVRPLSMLADAKDAPLSSDAMTYRDTQLRTAIALVLIASFSLSYVIVWLLPVLLGAATGEVWSLTSGVSSWPPLACAILILLLCRVATLFISKRSQYLREDLHFLFNLGAPRRGVAKHDLLDRITRYHDYLTDGSDEAARRDKRVLGLSALFLLSFGLIAVLDNQGSVPSLSLLAGTRTIDPVQLLLVLAVSAFTARLFLLGRESRRLLEAVRIQDNQQLALRLLADASAFERNDGATGESREERGVLDDGAMEAHTQAFLSQAAFRPGSNLKADYRATRFSASVNNDLVDIELAELVTKQIQRLFYLPVGILALLAVAALPIFDPWPISRSVLVFGGVLTSALVLQAWRLDFTARSVKKNLIAVLNARIVSARRLQIDPDLKTRYVEMLEHARHVIESEHEGAFQPLTALPLVRILIVAVGAIGLIISQAIFGTGFSF